MGDYEDYQEYKISVTAYKYVPPFLIMIGIVGNILVFIVLQKSSMKSTTTSLYLRFVAVFDSLVLCTGLLRSWLILVIRYDIRNYSPAACKIHTWSTSWTIYTSSWLLVSVTLERCFSVWFPHKIKVICTKRATTIVIVTIITVMAVLPAHFFYGLGDGYEEIIDSKYFSHCEFINEQYMIFVTEIWSWIDFCVYSVLPFSILIACNILIIYKIVSGNRRILRNDAASENNIQNRSESARRSQSSSITLMLLATSVTYVVCTSPFCVYVICLNVGLIHVDTPREIALHGLRWSLVQLLMYTNNCINFVLYCATGQRFRQEFRSLFCSKQRQHSNIQTVQMTLSQSANGN